MTKPPLEGIRVISFGTGGVIPDCGKTLGEMGADVIKIEYSENLDMMRTFGGDINNNYGFNETNRNKRSFGVNLKTEKGRELVRELIKMSDVVGENFRAGVVESLGMDYDSVNKLNPDIIYVCSQGFGRGGPYSDYKAYGPMMAAASGLLRLWAHPDDPYPVGANAPIPDHLAAKHAVLAVLAAMDYRRRTGKGQFIDLSLVEVGANLIGTQYLDYTINNRIPQPLGNTNPYVAPHGCYPCKGDDQWCTMTVYNDNEWHRFCDAIGNPTWTLDPKFSDVVNRLENTDELDRQIEKWTIQHDPHEVMVTLQTAGIAAGIVQRAADALDDSQLKWLNAFIQLDHPVAGKRIYPDVPFKISNMEFTPSAPAPLFGQHTVEICHDMLHMHDEEINKLKEVGVLEVPSD